MMRELFKQKIQQKGKRVTAGIMAVVLAVMIAIPMNVPVAGVKAEEPADSIEITGGKLKYVKYWVLQEEEDEAETNELQTDEAETDEAYNSESGIDDKAAYELKEKVFSEEDDVWDFEGENVIKITVSYEADDGYMLESVQKNGVSLGEDSYTLNEDGTITYDAGEGNFIGSIRFRCIPKELQISNLKAVRGQDDQGVPANSVKLSWNAPVISEKDDCSLDEYRLIIRKEVNGQEDIIFNEIYPKTAEGVPVCTYEDCGTTEGAASITAKYTVSVIADKSYEKDLETTFLGEGVSTVWNAVYDLELSVNGKGTVKLGNKEYGSSDLPHMIYNISSAEENVNLKVTLIPENEYGVSSFLVNGTEEKQEVENNTYEMCVEKSGSLSISFAPFAAEPSITTSGDKYTEIAENGTIEITSANGIEKTDYEYAGLEKPELQEEWKNFTNSFEGAFQTVTITAQELFGTESYAILRAYSSREGYADSDVAEQYYYWKPETPKSEAVEFEGDYEPGQWTDGGVTLNYENTSHRTYAGLQIGYVVNGQGDMKWQDMNQSGNTYSFTFEQSGEYEAALRFKMNDPNRPGEFVYGDVLVLTDNVKIDLETPRLEVSGYTSGTWVTEDVNMKLQNMENQISGTVYQYAVYDSAVQDEEIQWKACETGNQVRISCDEGENLTKYVYMRAVSNAGKASETVSSLVMIDKEKPNMPQVSFSEIDGENGWYRTQPVITIKQPRTDTGSQISIYYRLYQEGQDPDTIQEVLFDGDNQPVVPSDGRYIFTCYARDGAGNVSEALEQRIKADTGAPNGPSIEFKTENDSVLSHIINFISFGYFCNEKVVAVVQSSDSMSQIKEYGVWYTQDGKDSEVSIIQGETAELGLPENFKGTVSAYAEDYAGNRSEVSESDGLVYESTQAEITITTDADSSKWQGKDVNFHVITQDTQSGLRRVEYILNGRTIYQNDFTDSSHTEPVYMEQRDITATEEAVSSEGYTLQVKVTDNAGNQSEKSVAVYIDKTAPVISFGGIENDTYSNNTENLTVKIDEQIYDLNQVAVSATRTLDGVTTEYGMEEFVSDKINSEKNYAFSEDGFYVVTVSAVDAAGNAAVSKQISFTIDKTPPRIELSGLQNDSCSASDVTVNLNVEEAFFDTNSVTINVTKTLDGQTSSVDFGNWSNQGKNSSLSKSFGEDGTYLIEVQAKDAAGNQAAPQQLTFTVDKTAPEVSINGAGNYLITGNAVTLSFDVVESYFDTNNVTIQLQREDLSGNVSDISVGSWINSGKESSLSYELKEDGIYTSVITAVDRAGNEATARKTVTVDTSDPVIKHVDEMNGKYYQVFKLPYELSEMIADLTVPDISMYLNSDEYDGVSEVTEEGKYVFRMDVSDEVGHKAVAQAEFIVDNTPPKVVFHGIEDGMKSDSDITWSVSLADAGDLMTGVTVDGEKKKFDQENNTYQDILNQAGTHTIEINAKDLAGNTTKRVISATISEETSVTSGGANMPLAAGGFAAAAGAAGIGAGLIKRRGRKVK